MADIADSNNNDDDDLDAATDAMILRDNKTWSKGRLRRHKLMSMIQGNAQPSRKKIFSEVKIDEDRKIYTTEVQGKSILCAKIYNPAVFFMKEGNTTWTDLEGVHRLEIEDHEGILSTIPKQLLTQLRKLESLTINWTKIRSLPESLFNLPLISLYLQRNQIRSLSGIHLAAEQLTILDVSNNCIDSLPKTFGQLVNLVTLNASGNALHQLPISIGSLVRLKALDVSSNKLRSLPASIGTLIDLTSLDVSCNQLSELPDSLTGLPNLEDLQARSNCLSSLPASFHQLTRLNSLLLRGNRFVEVPAILGQLTNLTNLNMRENSIFRMKRPIVSLKCLVLDHNELTTIDDSLLGCVNLQLLSIQHNRLTEIPPGIVRMRVLRSLLVSHNGLNQVPAEVAQLGQLRHLGLRATKIQTIPIEVVKLPTLTNLELDECEELNIYLKLAYKEKGLPGVIEHLTDDSGTSVVSRNPIISGKTSLPIVNLDKRMTLSPHDIVSTEAVSKGAVSKEVVFKGDASRHTMMPVMESADETTIPEIRNGVINKQKRQEAGLSIVTGRTVPLDDFDGGMTVSSVTNATYGPTINHVARHTIFPTNIEMQTIGDAQTQVDGNRRDGQGAVRVIRTLDQFGDLVTASTDVPSDENSHSAKMDVGRKPGSEFPIPATRSEMTTFGKKPPPVASKPTAKVELGATTVAETAVGDEYDDDEDLSQLYSQVMKKQATSKKSGVRFVDD